MASQLGSKLAVGSSNSSHHEEKKTYGENIFSKTGPHNQPHDFKNQTRPTTPKFLESKENLHTPYGMKEEVDEWQQLSEECRKTLPFDQCFKVSSKLKYGGNEDRTPFLNKELKYTIGKVTIPSFDGSSQMYASAWIQKLDVYFKLNPMVEEDALKMDILHLEGESNDWWFHGINTLGHDQI